MSERERLRERDMHERLKMLHPQADTLAIMDEWRSLKAELEQAEKQIEAQELVIREFKRSLASATLAALSVRAKQ